MRLSISHDTTYHYEDQVRASIQYLRLTPHDSERQHVLSWQLDLPRPVRAQVDPFGNILHVLTLDEPHDAIIIGARGVVEIDELREAEHESQSAFPFLRSTRLTEPDDALRGFAGQHCHQRRDRTALIDLMHALNHTMVYTPVRPTSIPAPPKPSQVPLGCARTTPMRSWPAHAAWGSLRGMCRGICIPKTARTWPAMPGPKPGWMTPGTALT